MRRFTLVTALCLGLLLPAAAAALEANPHNVGDCAACHGGAPRFGEDTRKTVTFKTTADDPALCLGCHTAEQALHPVLVAAGSGPEGGRHSTRLPSGFSTAFAGKIVCVTCHYIHAPDGRYGLLRGFPGSPDPRAFASWQEFCAECHGANLVRRSAHRGDAGSCGFCHPAKPTPGRKLEVASDGRDLCRMCHARVIPEHFDDGDPFADRSECVVCHDPHGKLAANPSLLNEDFLAAAKESPTVRPHFRKAFCFGCHENTDDYTLRNENVNELCNRCHASGAIPGNIHPLTKVPATIAVPKGWPLTNGALTCLTCHEWGHEDQERVPKMVRGAPYAKTRDACWRCHDRVNFKVSDIHRDINEGRRCEFCHAVRPDPAKDTVTTVGFVADPNLPCVSCHEETHANLASHYLSPRKPPAGAIPSEMPLYKGQRMMCATCHNPHIGELVSHKLRGVVGESNDICIVCHFFE